ncbi:hypothetical protein [Hymenobacter sp. DG25A]|uniref:hypothetical protein n=1 Tax=Hymenobacter sp. DG25A TaxID=1385663 RepID=UPI0006BC982F|nr:hypothetical protein [Hymenobacter sp. DG25A]ALD20766.1 hypothetical protein AM218_05455 [Hymenobacter sp. DG25A]
MAQENQYSRGYYRDNYQDSDMGRRSNYRDYEDYDMRGRSQYSGRYEDEDRGMRNQYSSSQNRNRSDYDLGRATGYGSSGYGAYNYGSPGSGGMSDRSSGSSGMGRGSRYEQYEDRARNQFVRYDSEDENRRNRSSQSWGNPYGSASSRYNEVDEDRSRRSDYGVGSSYEREHPGAGIGQGYRGDMYESGTRGRNQFSTFEDEDRGSRSAYGIGRGSNVRYEDRDERGRFQASDEDRNRSPYGRRYEDDDERRGGRSGQGGYYGYSEGYSRNARGGR